MFTPIYPLASWSHDKVMIFFSYALYKCATFLFCAKFFCALRSRGCEVL